MYLGKFPSQNLITRAIRWLHAMPGDFESRNREKAKHLEFLIAALLTDFVETLFQAPLTAMTVDQ